METSLSAVLLRLLLGLVIGFFIGMTGVGGGVLVVPALTVILRLPASVAVGTASLYSFFTKMYAAYLHYRLKTIDFATARIFVASAIPCNLLVSWGINRHLRGLQDGDRSWLAFQTELSHVIAAALVISAAVTAVNLFKGSEEGRLPGRDGMAGGLLHSASLRRLTILLSGMIVGALMGATSVGGGVLVVPILIVVLGLPPNRTVGTSIFLTVLLTLVTAIVYGKSGELDVPTAALMATSSTIGVHAGSRFTVRLPGRVLQGVIVGVVLIAAILMLIR